ncbi:hypothetical protein BLA23254_03023 [Burkholderia lata]|uniref:Uncharacterized protein n=1 Tax=Burkholderia lata (strain ATCC 17760 / DSM 23089 / LMG 22485 / NCIMB 9086 / R18194 / 383) TaxID=482957 RepID=A0A6P2LDP8_BURL3|nr:hypothetical protein BLA23254_03023 [Burkholderia lata]
MGNGWPFPMDDDSDSFPDKSAKTRRHCRRRSGKQDALKA